MTRTTARVILLSASALALSACGVQGDLDRPGPIFGPDARARAAAENTAPRAQEPPPGSTPRRSSIGENPDQSTDVMGHGPGGTIANPGDRPDPSAAPPGGRVIPDPYNNPP